MKNALIDPTVQVVYIGGWTDTNKPIFETLPNSARVAEVSDSPFPVAPPLFWVECADDVVADQWYYDTSTQQILVVPNVPKPGTQGVASV
jgi:hypothetical protein